MVRKGRNRFHFLTFDWRGSATKFDANANGCTGKDLSLKGQCHGLANSKKSARLFQIEMTKNDIAQRRTKNKKDQTDSCKGFLTIRFCSLLCYVVL